MLFFSGSCEGWYGARVSTELHGADENTRHMEDRHQGEEFDLYTPEELGSTQVYTGNVLFFAAVTETLCNFALYK